MGRKDKFDPLGGSLSGGGMPKQKKSKKNKSPDLLTGGRSKLDSDLRVEDYSMDRYAGYSDGTDALTPSGASTEKKKKKGFFGSLFGGKKKPAKPISQKIPEMPKSEVAPKSVVTAETVFEEDLFEEETPVMQPEGDDSLPQDATPIEHLRESAPEVLEPVPEMDLIQPGESPIEEIREAVHEPGSKYTATHDPNTCAICGANSETKLPEFTIRPGSFEADNSVPLCKTCYQAVNTLMNFRSSSDEEEICDEWSELCPKLDQDFATHVVTEGRRYR